MSPSNFWRRWHISFSSWIRDYLYISLGGSRVDKMWKFALVLIATMGLSGLWHGAAWNFVVWGLYHGVLVFAYHLLGMGGRWKPGGIASILISWFVTFNFIVVGWTMFRASSMSWLLVAISNAKLGISGDSLVTSVVILSNCALFSLPFFFLMFIDRAAPNRKWIHSIAYGFLVVWTICYVRESGQDFIYFQF
ncbi:MAG: hypothetical protein GY847_33835 [Proteobacteria bacterium]|nr:hypothetical protein [Pseudomonadota bacterium]